MKHCSEVQLSFCSFFFHAQTLQIPYHITVSVQSQPRYHQTSPHVWLQLSRDLPPGGKTKVQWVGQCRYTRVPSQQQLLQSKQFSVFQNQTSVSASLWSFLCVFVFNYYSAFPEVFPVMRCLLKTKKVLEEVLFHAMQSYVISQSFTS